MKNKVSGSGDSIFKKKGFFVALYSCLGAVMVLALVISFYNLTGTPPGNEMAQGTETPEQEESVNVNTDQVESYLQQMEAEEEARKNASPTAAPLPSAAAIPPLKPAAPSAAPTVPAGQASPSAASETETSGSAAITDAAATLEAGAAVEPAETAAAETPQTETEAMADTAADAADTASEAAANEAAGEETPQELAFSPFSADDAMAWPIQGEIAMDFSTDKLIYDPTLDQYRTNDDLRIAAQEGTPVKAGADGQVMAVGSDHVYGNYVQIDHGNGWVATYGQLMEGVLVREGDIITTGQVIGGVGQPSYYGSLNGTHMNLRITKDNEPVDPRSVLAEG